MNRDDNRIGESGEERQPSRASTALQVLFLCEAAALLIALLLPITPKRFGSKGGLAKWFVDDPTYAQEVLVGWLLTNVLLALIVIAFVWITRRNGSSTASER